jgi:uncharacterized protein (TIGR00730 family)
MIPLKTVCVYCGASAPQTPAHRQAATQLGELLAAHNITLVYGGARIGMMGLLADSAVQHGGKVIGIIPEHLQQSEVGHHGITALHVVPNMHTRKQMMFDMSDAFVVLAGGIGTMDELFEMLTWRQLKMHDKPIILVDTGGYWQPLLALLDHIIENGYASPAIRALYTVAGDVEGVMGLLLKVV